MIAAAAMGPQGEAIHHTTSAGGWMECVKAFLSNVTGRRKKKKQQVKSNSRKAGEINRRVGDGRKRMINMGKDQCWIKIRRLQCDYRDNKYYY